MRLTAPFRPMAGALCGAGHQPEKTAAAEARSVWSVLPEIDEASDAAAIRGLSAAQADEALRRRLDEARLQAEAVLRDARTRADELLASAGIEAEATRSGAEAEGYAAGFLQARSQVEAELHDQFDYRVAQMRGQVDEIVAAVVEAREAMWRGIEGEITDLALEIARKVIKTEVTQNNKVVEGVVKDALRRVTDRSSVRVVIHPTLLDQMRESRSALVEALDNVQNLAIDPDQRVAPGGCLIETNAGCIDARLETQLQQVEQALQRSQL